MVSSASNTSVQNGNPINVTASSEAATITASTDSRPCCCQYTSSRFSHSANSSRVSPSPTPNATASNSRQGVPGSSDRLR